MRISSLLFAAAALTLSARSPASDHGLRKRKHRVRGEKGEEDTKKTYVVKQDGWRRGRGRGQQPDSTIGPYVGWEDNVHKINDRTFYKRSGMPLPTPSPTPTESNTTTQNTAPRATPSPTVVLATPQP